MRLQRHRRFQETSLVEERVYVRSTTNIKKKIGRDAVEAEEKENEEREE